MDVSADPSYHGGMEPTVANHIEITPGVCGGKPRIAGHRIRVQDVAIWHERFGMSADEIVSEHPEISLADVHAALLYFYDHQDDIREDIRKAEELAEAVRKENPSKLLERLKGRHAKSDSVSS